MPSTSSIPAFFDALKALLDARPGIVGPPLVTVATGDLAAETPPEAIILGGATGPRTNVGLRGPQGISQDQDVIVRGAIWIVRPGSGEPAIKAARDRAYVLLGEVEGQLKATPTVSGVCHYATVTGDALEQGPGDAGRWCQISFSIQYRARLV